MQISALEEYGLRCALQIAALEAGAVISASQIAEREGISVQYASKIMHLFRKAGLVQANRGMQGGFFLSEPASKVSIKTVFSALKEEKNTHFCDQFSGNQEKCVHLESCSVRPVWNVLSSYFDSVLAELTLADLAQSESSSRKRIETFAQRHVLAMQSKLQINSDRSESDWLKG